MVTGGCIVGLGLFRWIASMLAPSNSAAQQEQVLSTQGTIVHYHLGRNEYKSGPADDPNSAIVSEAQLHIGYEYRVHGVLHRGEVYLGTQEGLSEEALSVRYPFYSVSTLPIYYASAHPDKSGITHSSVAQSITKEPPGSLIVIGLVLLAMGCYFFLRAP
jgi:hypothetical protein